MVKKEDRLVSGLKKGSQESFNELFELYYDRCYEYARSIVKDDEATADIVQNVFLKIWTGREGLDSRRSFHSYILTAVKNEAISFLRLKVNRNRENENAISDMEDLSQNILSEIHASDISTQVTSAIEKMPGQRQKVYRMSREEGLSHETIAKQLQISPKTVERHITLALKDIRKELS